MIDFKALSAPFPPEEVSWRLGSVSKAQKKGMALAYIDARVVMDRLDEVCGPGGWQCKYSHANGKTVCDIGIWCGDDVANPDPLPVDWVWKADGAGDSDIEAEKGALSDAFKRAAVRWGIGRYLYSLDSPWVEIEEIGQTGKYRIVKGAYRDLDMVIRRATQAILNGQPKPVDGMAQAKDDIAQMQNKGEQPIPAPTTSGRTMAELWATNALGIIKGPGFDMLAYRDWLRAPCTPKGTKSNAVKLEELREKHPDLAQKIDEAADNLRVAA